MNTLILAILSLIGYIIAYRTYGKYLGKKILEISTKNKMPSHELQDGVDYVPTKRSIIFGHHFTTIAGLGPIVGPAIGIIWGWLPAFIWVFIGSIFIGAVHDFATLVVSARNKGKTIGDLTGDVISPSTRYAFQFLIQFLLLIVLSVFAMIVGILFTMYPEAVFPVWMQIPIAVWLGWEIRKGKNDLLYSIIAVILMYLTIFISAHFHWQIVLPPIMGSSVSTWCIILFIYVYFASTVPVQKLLQPRDYINSHQLLIAMALLIIGLFVAHPVITAPAVNPAAFSGKTDIPSMMPLLFITIACGAVSGFHCLASSGTTVKQVDKEKDTLFIGYGGMILESFLAVLVLMAIAGGLGIGLEIDGNLFKGADAFSKHYSSWAAASGLDAKLEAFIVGAANLFKSYGIPPAVGKSLIAVFIVSFANTTLDSATRIQRFSLQELFKNDKGIVKKPMNNRFVATFFVVLVAAILTFIKSGASGAMMLWPLFGALNQLLAALALGIVTVYLYHKNKNILYTAIPMVIILLLTVWAMGQNIYQFAQRDDHLLLGMGILIFILTIWLLYTSIYSVIKKQKK